MWNKYLDDANWKSGKKTTQWLVLVYIFEKNQHDKVTR